MLVYNFKRILKARGIDRPFSYLVKLGYSDNYATRIANNRVERLSLKDIEKFCLLFQCTPNDLMEWFPSGNDSNIDSHPLISLKRSDKVFELTKFLNTIPLEKLDNIENLIRKEIEK